ncbi:MAG: sulfite exporter TauE/SafE family protein, partial [Gammaproteobacteria bacterium]|nr:sulfite exporter TauE/SafE family protein [Gammaproteobacteria bacterium]
MDLIITLTGFFVGLLVGITGVGGGAIMTPALIYGFGVPAWIAVGTDLLFAAITKSVGVFAHARQKTIDWLVVLRLAAGSLPGAGLALFVISELHLAEEELNQIINSFLGVALLLTSLVLLFKPRANKNYFSDHTRNRLTVIAGFILGL